jgi:hypothetical protein
LPEEIQNPEHATRLENLKFSLKKANEAVAENNRKSHFKNKKIRQKRQRKDISKLVRWCTCFAQLRNMENSRNSGKYGRALSKLYQNCLALTIE